MTDRPNVVLVHCHDLGRQLGCYGAPVETPNVDAIATDGVRFDDYYCAAPQCSPSRGSIVTGKHPQRHGLLGLTNVGGWELPRSETTLGQLLRSAGYETHLFGLQHQVRSDVGERLGFDEIHGDNSRALDVADRFAATVDDLAAADGRFFADVGFFEPHRPYRQEAIADAAYQARDPEAVPVPGWLPDRPGVRRDLADLRTLIERTVDPAVGRVRSALRDAGVADETLLVFTTDHGIAMPRAKGTCYDAGLGTALLVAGPGVPEDRTDEHLLSNVDLLPTLCDTLDVDAPADVDGQSFAPLLGGDGTHEPRDAVYAGMTWHDVYCPTRAVRTDRYKYVRNATTLPAVYMPADVFGGAAGRELAWEYYTTNRPREELYDLEADPHETENLLTGGAYERNAEASAPPEHAEAYESLRERLEAWQRETGDPLLDGDVPAPERPGEALDVFSQ